MLSALPQSRRSTKLALFLLATLALSGCKKEPLAPDRSKAPLKLWHTFNPAETSVLNAVLSDLRREHPDWSVTATVLPFAHAQNAYRTALSRCAPDAPDVLRVELPWIAAFVDKGFLRTQPADAPRRRDYLAAAQPLAQYRGKAWVWLHSVDGLALLYNRKLVPKPPATLDELVRLGRELTTDRQGRHPGQPGFDASAPARWGFYIRADGYWFLPFLWAFGGDLLQPAEGRIQIADPRAIAALRYYRDLARVHHIAPPHLRLSNDYEDQLQRFGRGELAMMVNGPWATAAIIKQPAFRQRAQLGVAPFPRGVAARSAAPLSGHGFVVSRCSKEPERAWRLVAALASARTQARFAAEAGLLPALSAAYDDPRVRAAPLIGAFRKALAHGRTRPQHAVMGRIFDDFSPAVQAVLLGDASPREALRGVARAWARLLGLSAAAWSRPTNTSAPSSRPTAAPATTRPSPSPRPRSAP